MSNLIDSTIYFDEALEFLKEYQWIYNYPNTDILSRNILDEMPKEWLSYFNKLKFSELKSIPLLEGKVSIHIYILMFYIFTPKYISETYRR